MGLDGWRVERGINGEYKAHQLLTLSHIRRAILNKAFYLCRTNLYLKVGHAH